MYLFLRFRWCNVLIITWIICRSEWKTSAASVYKKPCFSGMSGMPSGLAYEADSGYDARFDETASGKGIWRAHEVSAWEGLLGRSSPPFTMMRMAGWYNSVPPIWWAVPTRTSFPIPSAGNRSSTSMCTPLQGNRRILKCTPIPTILRKGWKRPVTSWTTRRRCCWQTTLTMNWAGWAGSSCMGVVPMPVSLQRRCRLFFGRFFAV